MHTEVTAGSSRPVLRLKNVSHAFDRWGVRVQALSSVTLDLAAGEWCALIGPNGVGKSTLLNVVSGALQWNGQGTIEICGHQLGSLSPRERSRWLVQVRQDPILGTAPDLTVAAHLAVAVSENGHRFRPLCRARREDYRGYLGSYGLADRLDQPVGTLSGGQRQLLVLLLARLRGVRLLLIDEGLAALDPRNAELCLRELRRFVESGSTVLMVTHDLNLASTVAEHVIGLFNGTIVFDTGRSPDLKHLSAGEIWRRVTDSTTPVVLPTTQ
jgi:putative tryptophan/tyrosine transport system ATP-binding protein